jgi:signal transduction histidine kinase
MAERRRLAQDLHDSVTQTLTGLQLTAKAAVELWDTQPAQARVALDTIRSLADGAATELRAVLLDLRDAVLERQGLVAALEAYCAVVRQRSGLRVELHVVQPGPGTRMGMRGQGRRLPAGHEDAVYRLVQEALANVVKHARATRASVTLVLDATLQVCVEDDGVGFGAPPPAFSYGLAGMCERVGALGGRLHFDNGPAGGARVIAELPVSDLALPSTRPALDHGIPAGYPEPWSAHEVSW